MQITVGVGAGAKHLGVDRVVDLGPLHPSAHGAYRLRLTVRDDEVITSAEPLVGHLHRGAEKLFEVRDYRQVLTLANRHDWLAAFCNELAVALAVERMTGMDVPPRAQWLRALLCELNRVMAHLVFLAPLTDPVAAARGREAVQAVLEEASGGRIHFMANRIGGLREDVPAGWAERVAGALDAVEVPEVPTGLAGLGVLSRADALARGVTGPIGRASGVDLDLRRDDPLPAYRELDVRPSVRDGGDAHARVACMVDDLAQAVALARECLRRLPGGPVNLRLPKAVKAPEGSVYTRVEAPLGVSGVHLASRGEKTPWRLKLRTPSFNNVQALSALLPGTPVAQLPLVLGSFAVVVGDIDR
ncbi:NADH-quinone oxidoreductase subunit D [Actinosynnema pretiosum subsp. pretiosum]|uniref:NADH dehydrogenase (Quinone) n=2 Tax=Actinosynnema TaxID=40566 RepID=C6WGH3_ACTMD|nr:NADH-quinone oxidoreductase subunit D [Actinosynnema mirum]ACU34289.1 NADH dehydrogenase (quinone) [Actinosynnema mirum DSM 43827]AXX27664.1 NADH-ubiquinone oxidoreductase chain D [Actinosynnema pretiosum subsp. pretiosum]QUF01636.1 NADH-quinone oxidoreductase subunit D [Actinosynnema pretiosum subsp. pretiosum]